MRASRRLLSTVLVLSSVLPAVGCHKKKPVDFNRALPPGQMALRKLDPSEYPDFSVQQTDLSTLNRALDYSIEYLGHKSSQQFFPYLDISHDRARATLAALKQVINDPGQSNNLNQVVREKFEVYKSIGAPKPEGEGYTEKVLFTGYFTPIYEASTTREGPFQYPLYKRPADLNLDPTGTQASRKTADGQYVLYYTRAEIEHGNVLAGQELVWLKSRWDAYVITVQGSAILRLTDGRKLEVGYAGNNGFPYTSPGKRMLADGAITRDQLSLRGMGAHFRENPADLDKYLDVNDRFVFFSERPGGPFGCLNVPVTPFATIATDKAVYPRALMSFLTVPVPASGSGETRDFRGFMMDQDAGGAIRAAGRSDIYMGIGEQAEQIAGHQLHEGEIYYLAVKPELIGNYPPAASRQRTVRAASH